MNFRELVNRAIEESGTSLDEIESADFDSPSDPMQVRFKNWVRRAWREIQIDRNEWHYISKTATINLAPRIYVEAGSRATTPAAGYTYTSNETLQDLEVLSVDLVSGAWASDTAVAYIDVEGNIDQLKINETVDETSPNILETDVFTIRDTNVYDLTRDIADLNEVQVNNVYVQDTGNSSNQANSSSNQRFRVRWVDWDHWNAQIMGMPISNMPLAFTRDPKGKYKFWPALDKEYTFQIGYSVDPTELSAEADTPAIPSQYHEGIVWKAVMFWAQYDQRPQDEKNAYRNYMFYKRALNKYLKPGFSWEESRFDG